MRWLVPLLVLVPFAGCLSTLQDMTADCGDRKEAREGPDPWLNPPDALPGINETLFVWSLDSSTKACTDQHATYSVSLGTSAGDAPCAAAPSRVELEANVGFTGSTKLLKPSDNGYYSVNGDMGVRQASEPQWLFLYLNVHVPAPGATNETASDPESRDAPPAPTTTEDCARQIVRSLDMSLSYLEPKEGS